MEKSVELVCQLIKAAEIGDIQTARMSLSQGLDVNAKNLSGVTALHCAVDKKQHEFILFLLKEGASINIKTNDGSTPLHHAVNSLSTTILAILLDHSANVNEKDNSGKTALHLACYFAKADLAIMLLQRGANASTEDATGKTPLHILVSTGGRTRFAGQKLKIITALIELKANINAQDQDGDTPLHLALRSVENRYVLQRLLDGGASVEMTNKNNETSYNVCLLKCMAGNFVWEVTEHDSFNNRTIIIQHILKLTTAKLHITIDVRDKTNSDYDFEIYKYLLEQELERIKAFKFDGFSLNKVFSSFSNPNYLENENLSKQIEAFLNSPNVVRLFPYFGFMLRNTYVVSKVRANLLSKAYKFLCKICVFACAENLPGLVAEQICQYLANEDLKSMIESGQEKIIEN